MPKVRDAMQSYLYLTLPLHGTCFLLMILSFSLGEKAVLGIHISLEESDSR